MFSIQNKRTVKQKSCIPSCRPTRKTRSLFSIFGILPQLVGSVTTSVAIIVGGIALMILPTLVVGNELLILGGVAMSVGGWFLAHRHGKVSATAALDRTNAS